MAGAGLLHVTVIAATLLRDAGGSDSEPADTYASVGCGSQNFITSSVKNVRAKPAWNESHTFKFEERNELESQHILVEIFAEKPKLDELLGLAKIPLYKVVTAGDEISTHSLNRPDEEYIGHEQYSGHVKVALRWHSAQASGAPAYPQTYTPAARYNPHGSSAPLSRQTSRSGEQLQTSRSGEQLQTSDYGEELLYPEDIYGASQDRKVHHRSSSYPSRSYSFRSSAPSPSQTPWQQPRTMDDTSTQQPPSNILPSSAHPPSGPTPNHSSFEAGSTASRQQEHERRSAPHVQYAGPHVPYVPHEGNKAGNVLLQGKSANYGHAAYVTPVESTLANSDSKQQEDQAKLKLSKSKQAEMAKLAELSRLTESAKIQATGFAKAGQQPSSRPKPSTVEPQQQQQQSRTSTRPKNNGVLPHRANQVPSNKSDGYQVEQQTTAPNGRKKNNSQPQQRLTDDSQRLDVQSKELAVVPTILDIIQAQPQRPQGDEMPGHLLPSSQRPADVFYEKAIKKAEKPEKKKTKKGGPFRQTLKILRKTSKIFGM